MSNDGIARIEAWKLALNLDQFKAAKRLGISQPTLSRILSGRTQPTLATVQQIAPALGVSAVDLAVEFGLVSLADEPFFAVRERLKRLPAHDQVTLLAIFAVLIDTLEGINREGESKQPILVHSA